MKNYPYSAFSGYGIELEYIIVDEAALNVMPIADRLLVGAEDMDLPRGDAAWSNELALHVIEAKTAGPISDLAQAAQIFRREVNAINSLLQAAGAQLMPCGMHPWMDPFTETRLWPHQNNEIYSAFDRIFGCQGHGWSNLQSMHINFPFRDEEEFGKLHAACRVVLPLLPAIAASSPFWEGKRAPHLDQRLAVYQNNCKRVPSVTGQVVPEAVYTYDAYQNLLQGIYRDIAPLDPEGTLQEEWLNARGAIARFDRGAIEIRVIDTQECPEQDLALAFFTTELVHALYHGEFGSLEQLTTYPTTALYAQLSACITAGTNSKIEPAYAQLFQSKADQAQALFAELLDRLIPLESSHYAALKLIEQHGNLAERILKAHGPVEPTQTSLLPLYRRLCACLSEGLPLLG